MKDRTAILRVEGVHRRFGDNRVLHDVNLTVASGQVVGIVGESGCGKSVLLSMLLGTLAPSVGTIQVVRGGTRVAVERPGPDRGIVYQGYSLMPFLTAHENAALGPKLAYGFGNRVVGSLTGAWRRARREHLERAEQMLVRVGLGDALRKYPHELSGGMRQRVAIAQALLMRPEILLLDEPFGALDDANRESLQQLFLSIYWEDNMAAAARGEKPPYTVLIVTHELREALLVGDRVVGLSRYWDWKAEGHAEHPGATIVYDWKAPVERPGEVVDHATYLPQIAEIRAAVMSKDSAVKRGDRVQFWNQVAAGEVDGVLAARGT